MSSGRRESVLLFCTSLIGRTYLDPIDHYEPDIIHAFIINRDDMVSEEERRLYESSKQNIQCKKIIEHRTDTSDYDGVLSEMMEIINGLRRKYRDDLDIYVNISAGTSEYSAASLIASMMMKDVIPFNVSTEKYQVEGERVKEVFYENGRPVGMTKKTREPNVFSTYAIQKPDEKLVLGLGLLDDQIAGRKQTSAPVMIPLLTSNGLMTYTKADNGKPDQKSTMNYQRNFVDRWIDNGWVEKVSKREMKITEEGKTILDVFLSCYRE